MAGLDRAVAFDRTVDQARSQAPALFPPEISCKKFMFEDGSCEHVYHHATLGEVGRVRVQGDRVTCRVAGDLGDPLAQERNAIFGPIAEQLARAGNKRCFQSVTCEFRWQDPCGLIWQVCCGLIWQVAPGGRSFGRSPPRVPPQEAYPGCRRLASYPVVRGRCYRPRGR